MKCPKTALAFCGLRRGLSKAIKYAAAFAQPLSGVTCVTCGCLAHPSCNSWQGAGVPHVPGERPSSSLPPFFPFSSLSKPQTMEQTALLREGSSVSARAPRVMDRSKELWERALGGQLGIFSALPSWASSGLSRAFRDGVTWTNLELEGSGKMGTVRDTGSPKHHLSSLGLSNFFLAAQLRLFV